MHHHQRHHPLGPEVEPAEQHTHDDVPYEPPEALIEVVRATDQGAADEHRNDSSPGLAPASEQVAHHHHLLQDSVLDGEQQQHRHGPPSSRQVRRRDGCVVSQLPRDVVQHQTTDPDTDEHR